MAAVSGSPDQGMNENCCFQNFFRAVGANLQVAPMPLTQLHCLGPDR